MPLRYEMSIELINLWNEIIEKVERETKFKIKQFCKKKKKFYGEKKSGSCTKNSFVKINCRKEMYFFFEQNKN